jgi:hypothetical protein
MPVFQVDALPYVAAVGLNMFAGVLLRRSSNTVIKKEYVDRAAEQRMGFVMPALSLLFGYLLHLVIR